MNSAYLYYTIFSKTWFLCYKLALQRKFKWELRSVHRKVTMPEFICILHFWSKLVIISAGLRRTGTPMQLSIRRLYNTRHISYKTTGTAIYFWISSWRYYEARCKVNMQNVPMTCGRMMMIGTCFSKYNAFDVSTRRMSQKQRRTSMSFLYIE